jgi:hypothetical protein
VQFLQFQLNAFKSNHLVDMADGARGLQQIIEKTVINIKWMEKNYASIRQWLENRQVDVNAVA